MKELEENLEKKIAVFEIFRKNVIEKQGVQEEDPEKILDSKLELQIYFIELNFLFSDLIFCISFLYRNHKIESKKIRDFYTENADNLYKPNFHIDNGLIKENVTGFLETKKDELLNSENMKMFTKLLE